MRTSAPRASPDAMDITDLTHIDPAYKDQIEDERRPDGSWINVHWDWRTDDDGKHWIFSKIVTLDDPPGHPGDSWTLWPRTDIAKVSSAEMLDMLFGSWDPIEVVGLLRQLADS